MNRNDVSMKDAEVLLRLTQQPYYLADDPLDVQFDTQELVDAFAKGVAAGLLLSSDDRRLAEFLLRASAGGES